MKTFESDNGSRQNSLRQVLRRLDRADGRQAIAFRLVFAAIDVAILAFFLLGPYLRSGPSYLIIDYAIAVWIAAEMVGRAVAAYSVREWIRRPMTWIDFVVLATLLLPDLLFNFAFLRIMAEEAGEFSFGDVVNAITAKMIRRHPHVFARSAADTPDAVKKQWDEIKQAEKRERTERRLKRGVTEDFNSGLLGSVQRSFPALTEALKLQERAAKVGFDWSAPEPILDKIEEEIGELRVALREGDQAKVSDELGDLIFAVVNIGRHAACRSRSRRWRQRTL